MSSNEKKVHSFSLSADVSDAINGIPKNDRSRFVNQLLRYFLVKNRDKFEFKYGRLDIIGIDENEEYISKDNIKDKIVEVLENSNLVQDQPNNENQNQNLDDEDIKESEQDEDSYSDVNKEVVSDAVDNILK